MSQRTHTAIITSANPAKLSPIEAALMDRCNQLHEAKAANRASVVDALKADLDALLEKYEASDAEDHPHPRWAIPHERALVASALGERESAVMYEEIALEHAQTPRQMEISLGNLSERCLRLGRIDEAIEYFFRARDVTSTSVPILVVGAEALFAAGYKKEADAIFRAFLSMPEQLRPGTELWAYLEYEAPLLAMRRELSSLDRLMSAFEALKPEGGVS